MHKGYKKTNRNESNKNASTKKMPHTKEERKKNKHKYIPILDTGIPDEPSVTPCSACPRFLVALEEANWPEDRIRMMALFWRNIQVHKYRSLRDPIAQKTLLVYQAEQCRHWHVAAKSSTGPYNISTVNEKVLADTREKVYWEERLKRDNARDYKVSL
ncbi:uncharacterized protein EDB93DRAFT_1109371 [Suillus bovinus]|uniref:uncharacterized protein n=1 Tax=Suillus bovinus TaxID=48563 RepID=UPI001B886DAB|nr:uncharacterized protein EDB93DRAFT_1109371 [Suillus bovinus]KAG2127261.1 hypothetical protein EDB93DRAFT_1109371 [Suillus bovinus]